jgi:hypothetical protein
MHACSGGAEQQPTLLHQSLLFDLALLQGVRCVFHCDVRASTYIV